MVLMMVGMSGSVCGGCLCVVGVVLVCVWCVVWLVVGDVFVCVYVWCC